MADFWDLFPAELQQLEKADQERYELQKKVKALESGSALAAQKVSLLPPLPGSYLVGLYNIMCPCRLPSVYRAKRKTILSFEMCRLFSYSEIMCVCSHCLWALLTIPFFHL